MVYARVVRFVLGPDTQWEADRMADVVYMWLQACEGFQGVTFLGDYHLGEYQWTSYWSSLEHATTSYEAVYPRFLGLIGDKFQWKPCSQIFEIYHPKTLSLGEAHENTEW